MGDWIKQTSNQNLVNWLIAKKRDMEMPAENRQADKNLILFMF